MFATSTPLSVFLLPHLILLFLLIMLYYIKSPSFCSDVGIVFVIVAVNAVVNALNAILYQLYKSLYYHSGHYGVCTLFTHGPFVFLYNYNAWWVLHSISPLSPPPHLLFFHPPNPPIHHPSGGCHIQMTKNRDILPKGQRGAQCCLNFLNYVRNVKIGKFYLELH